MTNEIIGKILHTSAKSRLVEDHFTGVKYWIPKSCTFDFNPCDTEGNFLLAVNDWWWNKRHDFVAEDKADE